MIRVTKQNKTLYKKFWEVQRNPLALCYLAICCKTTKYSDMNMWVFFKAELLTRYVIFYLIIYLGVMKRSNADGGSGRSWVTFV